MASMAWAMFGSSGVMESATQRSSALMTWSISSVDFSSMRAEAGLGCSVRRVSRGSGIKDYCMVVEVSASTRKEYAARMNRVVDYIQNHLADPLDLDQLAAVACFSSFHFHRLF